MSADSFAAFRRHGGNELASLAEEHFKHDLTDVDREVLKTTASRVGMYATVGSVLGLGLGAFFALRLRQARKQIFDTIRAAEKPTHVQFASGRLEPIPDLTPMMKPSTLGDVAAYTFFGFGGLFVGGELGLLLGSYSSKRTIMKDEESKKRIETAFRKFRADVLRREIAELEKGTESNLHRATGGLLS